MVLLILTLLGLFEKDIAWAVFPGMGIVIGTYLTLSLWADGSLTNLSGGSAVVIASASLNATSAWQFISLIPMLMTFAAFLVSVYKVAKAF